MEYLKALYDGIVYSTESYFEKAERLKCEKCQRLDEDSCHCIECITNSDILDAYTNSFKYDSDINKIKSSIILKKLLPQKIAYVINDIINKDTNKSAMYKAILTDVSIFIQNNPQYQDMDDV
jgi:hypothetical protein